MSSDSYSKIKLATGKFWRVSIEEQELNDLAFLKELFKEAVERSNTTIIECHSHEFNPQGITIIAILADSHAVLHTWPEKRFIMVEIFTCGEKSSPSDGILYLKGKLNPDFFTVTEDFTRI